MYKAKIEKYAEDHKQEMLDDICELCRINSEKMSYQEGMPFGEGPAKALRFALEMADQYGFSISNYDNYVGTVDMNHEPKQLDILAHLDVVPAGEGWVETQPFEPVVKGDKLFGRGTADDKGPAIAALYAMRAVKELGIPLKKNVRLILGTDEECGSSDIAHYYANEEEAPMTFSPDGSFPVVNIEKGGLAGEFYQKWEKSEALPKVVSIDAGIKINVVPGKAYAVVEGFDHKTLAAAMEKMTEKTGVEFKLDMEPVAEITAIGAGAHASTPSEGNNALTALLELLDSLPLAPCAQKDAIHNLVELMPHGDTSGKALGINMEDELSGDLTLAFSLMKMTDAGFDASFDSRCPICSNEENVLKVVKEKMAAKGITLTNDHMKLPHHVSGDSDFVKTLLNAYEKYTGMKGECQSMGGGTYVHNLKNGVAFGASYPGTDNRMHGADEFAVVSELVACVKIFAQVIIDLCS